MEDGGHLSIPVREGVKWPVLAVVQDILIGVSVVHKDSNLAVQVS
jgi:hypothetical protein